MPARGRSQQLLRFAGLAGALDAMTGPGQGPGVWLTGSRPIWAHAVRGVASALRQRGDRLTPQGAADAKKTGRDLLHPPYDAFVSTGAAGAIQMLEIVRHAVGQDDTPITPTMSGRARGTAPCTWFTVSSSRFGGGMGSRPVAVFAHGGGPPCKGLR